MTPSGGGPVPPRPFCFDPVVARFRRLPIHVKPPVPVTPLWRHLRWEDIRMGRILRLKDGANGQVRWTCVVAEPREVVLVLQAASYPELKSLLKAQGAVGQVYGRILAYHRGLRVYVDDVE